VKERQETARQACERLDKTQLNAQLDDRERPYYEHELAA
jgi:hypothetical protein